MLDEKVNKIIYINLVSTLTISAAVVVSWLLSRTVRELWNKDVIGIGSVLIFVLLFVVGNYIMNRNSGKYHSSISMMIGFICAILCRFSLFIAIGIYNYDRYGRFTFTW
jgi:hypothetical protein